MQKKNPKCPACGKKVARAEGHALGWKLLCSECNDKSCMFEHVRFYGIEPGDERKAVRTDASDVTKDAIKRQ